jgi:hypothetical protein
MSVLRAGDKFRRRFGRVKVFLDGVELWGVWYIDRRRRVMRTYDVNGDRQYVLNEKGNGVLSKQIRWKRRQNLVLQSV